MKLKTVNLMLLAPLCFSQVAAAGNSCDLSYLDLPMGGSLAVCSFQLPCPDSSHFSNGRYQVGEYLFTTASETGRQYRWSVHGSASGSIFVQIDKAKMASGEARLSIQREDQQYICVYGEVSLEGVADSWTLCNLSGKGDGFVCGDDIMTWCMTQVGSSEPAEVIPCACKHTKGKYSNQCQTKYTNW